MRKILSVAQIKFLDQYTIDHEHVSSIDLMERACLAFSNWFVHQYGTAKKISVVCGTGNNGGDGLGIARLLASKGLAVQVWIVRGSTRDTEEFKINLSRLQSILTVREMSLPTDAIDFENCEVIIDAIFGVGLSRPVAGVYASAIDQINTYSAIRIAVDIPSGLMVDQFSSGSIVCAHQTISFQTIKLSFLFPENFKFVGEHTVLDIGLSQDCINQFEVSNFLLSEDYIGGLVRRRSRFSHKGNYGHALIVAGSETKMGAAMLCARGCLRSGVGLLTMHIPRCGNDAMQIAVPEAMTSIDENICFFSATPSSLDYDCIGVGPGIGMQTQSADALAKLLEAYRKPMVIDADALNILSTHRELIALVPEESILTPHPKEFQRLVGRWGNDFERLEKQRNFSVQTNSVVILKGAFTSISTSRGDVFFNPTGNPGMATGGSGDVLTGILTGLVAQGYSPNDAALLGVYLHGLAGDLAADALSMNAMVATDLVQFLPAAFKKIQKENHLF